MLVLASPQTKLLSKGAVLVLVSLQTKLLIVGQCLSGHHHRPSSSLWGSAGLSVTTDEAPRCGEVLVLASPQTKLLGKGGSAGLSFTADQAPRQRGQCWPETKLLIVKAVLVLASPQTKLLSKGGSAGLSVPTDQAPQQGGSAGLSVTTDQARRKGGQCWS